ncbi:hypothetical protein EXD82_02440 [Peptacetobacter hominis]|uniref:Uncharacterized protein n=1 Tax=Peptacetobacter hominis TaxID=2743610 RepID=A0A544QX97_9FIRM|nr:hypothetical protein [Peptacetobacter hominis]TQQ85275.1 hypothetical protein EXD82_02440 [Peptacetobacter hominis]
MKKEKNKELMSAFYWGLIAIVWFVIAFLKFKTDSATWIIGLNLLAGVLFLINAIVKFVVYKKNK